MKMKLTELLHDFYAPMRRISDRTIELYGYTIKSFGDFLGREPTVADLDELVVARFLAHRIRTREPATAAKDRAQLRALWEWAARGKMVDTWPRIQPVNVPERVPEAWFTEEFQRLLTEASKETVTISGTPAALFWRAILLVCYDTGERISSVLALRWRNVRGLTVLYEAEDRKGKRRDLLREITEQTAEAMQAIKGSRTPDDAVFLWDKNPKYIWRRLAIILKRAGLPSGRKDKFHKIRKTCASYSQAGGVSAQDVLDHADPKTTRKYLDPRIVKPPSAISVLPKVG
jgi:integrase